MLWQKKNRPDMLYHWHPPVQYVLDPRLISTRLRDFKSPTDERFIDNQ